MNVDYSEIPFVLPEMKGLAFEGDRKIGIAAVLKAVRL